MNINKQCIISSVGQKENKLIKNDTCYKINNYEYENRKNHKT